jgi:hypothetical protein
MNIPIDIEHFVGKADPIRDVEARIAAVVDAVKHGTCERVSAVSVNAVFVKGPPEAYAISALFVRLFARYHDTGCNAFISALYVR